MKLKIHEEDSTRQGATLDIGRQSKSWKFIVLDSESLRCCDTKGMQAARPALTPRNLSLICLDKYHIISLWKCDGLQVGPNFRLHFHFRKWKKSYCLRRKICIFSWHNLLNLESQKATVGRGSFQCADRLIAFECNNLVLGGLPRVQEMITKLKQCNTTNSTACWTEETSTTKTHVKLYCASQSKPNNTMS